MSRAGCFFLWVILCAFGAAVTARADESTFSGHVKYQPSISRYRIDDVSTLLGPQHPVNHELDMRLNGEHRRDRFEFIAQGELLALGGQGLAAREAVAASLGIIPDRSLLPTDQQRLFDLSSDVIDEEHLLAVARLDRLSAAYLGDQLVLRLGRQAISWGNGLAFHVLDLFNPFSPIEIDKDYKAGDDMLYTQWLFDSGDDLQLLMIPRRDIYSGDVEEEESSAAIKYQRYNQQLNVGLDLLAGRHYGETMAGGGVSADLLQAVWRLNLTVTQLESHETVVSILANVDRSWVLCEKNVYGFLEYFHSGVGRSDGDYTELSPKLTERIARGELFTLGQDYIAAGLRIESTPLLNLFPSNIFNLNDSSGMFQFRLEYDWLQDFKFTTGVNLPYGDRGSEFGGIPLSDGYFAAPGRQYYIRLSLYF